MGSGADQTPLVSEEEREIAVQNRTLLIMYECIPKVLGSFPETNTKSLYVIKVLVV